jgi:hypothetical protein
MDVESPFHEEDIPVAKLICIEVMGYPTQNEERESNNIIIHFSCNKIIYAFLNYFCSLLICIVCSGAFFIFILGFPFV